MGGAYGMEWRKEKHMVLVGKPDRKTTLCMPWCEWDDNIKMVLKKAAWEGVGLFHTALESDW